MKHFHGFEVFLQHIEQEADIDDLRQDHLQVAFVKSAKREISHSMVDIN